jgi:hypothetical protein
MTNVSASNPITSFHEELYLLQFPREWRVFLQKFISTQMITAYIESECEKALKNNAPWTLEKPWSGYINKL